MAYACPICGAKVELTELQKPAGVTGGLYCPACQARVYFAPPFRLIVSFVSMFLAAGIASLLHIASIFWFVLASALIWIPVSLLLNAWSTSIRPGALKVWKPRRNKTFFEWLYDRDSAPPLFDKKR